MMMMLCFGGSLLCTPAACAHLCMPCFPVPTSWLPFAALPLLQATQACIELDQQLRERQAALEAAQVAEREAHAAWDEKR